ncbi:MAG: DEAD/DEAH box helicase family protein [Candidatus Paceibacterota bacterium]
MPFGEFHFQPKSAKDLNKQLSSAEKIVNDRKAGISLVPPSVERQDVLRMSLSEIKSKYSRRYEIYRNILMHKRRDVGSASSEEEIAQMRKWLKALNSLDSYIQKHYSGEEETLRGKQINVFEDLRNFLEAGGRDGYVKLPTGTGKTVLFIELVEALDLKTLIVVPTGLLVEQTEERFKEFAPNLETGKVYQHAKEYDRRTTIITYDSLLYQLRSGLLNPKDFDCLVLDEAHTALGEQRVKAVEQFSHALRLGFTATPEYSSEKKISDLLPSEIHRMNIREGVYEELLSAVSSVVARTEVDLSTVPIARSGEWEERALKKAVNIAGRNQSAVDLYCANYPGQLAVAYCVGVEHAQAVADLFNHRGISASVISGKTPSKEQGRILKDFKAKKIKILCNADLLIAGFDEPEATICLNLRPTRSLVVAEQRGGRVIRLNPKDQNKHATIIDFIDKGSESRGLVLFAEVADGAELAPRKKGVPREGGGGGTRAPIVHVPGIQVITDAEEIMRLVHGMKQSREDTEQKKEFLTYEDLLLEVRAAGIASSTQYKKEYKEHPGWPSSPDVNFRERWPGWLSFLGKEKEYLPFEKFIVEVRAAGITSGTDYEAARNDHPQWPPVPDYTYRDEWMGWAHVFGKEKKTFLTFTQLKEEVKIAGILDGPGYTAAYKQHSGWPSHPDTYYPEWSGWYEFLGTDFLKFETLKTEVRDAAIAGLNDYKKKYREHKGWPSNPNMVFKDQWPGWPAFLGKEVRERLPFETFRQEVLLAGVLTSSEYKRVYKEHRGWPATPDSFYKDEWPGWPAFLKR